MPRIFLPQPFTSGATMVLPAAAARHVQVLRLQPGEAIELFNGADGCDWPAEIVRIGRNAVDVRIGAARAVDRELACAVTLAFGIPANDRMDALVEKAGELGATAIQPLVCERSVLRLSGERAEAKRRHWSAVAAAASEQCGRARVTEILQVRAISSWLASEATAAAARRIVLSFDPAAIDAASALPGDPASAMGSVVVLSGPEGGLTLDEESGAVARGFVRVGLGARVLRVDTAPLALLAWLGVATMAKAASAER
jgi:16S rRNA (uracil1498-N3)-methyltransferase